MQFRLFSFALIILNCMDYSHCQGNRWRRSKRGGFYSAGAAWSRGRWRRHSHPGSGGQGRALHPAFGLLTFQAPGRCRELGVFCPPRGGGAASRVSRASCGRSGLRGAVRTHVSCRASTSELFALGLIFFFFNLASFFFLVIFFVFFSF